MSLRVVGYRDGRRIVVDEGPAHGQSHHGIYSGGVVVGVSQTEMSARIAKANKAKRRGAR